MSVSQQYRNLPGRLALFIKDGDSCKLHAEATREVIRQRRHAWIKVGLFAITNSSSVHKYFSPARRHQDVAAADTCAQSIQVLVEWDLPDSIYETKTGKKQAPIA